MYEGGDVFGPMLAAGFGIFMLVFASIGILVYLLMALGLMKMADNKGIENPWLAWIPIANVWIIGKIVETIEIGSRKFENAEIILLVGAFVGAIPFIGPLLSFAYTVLMFIVWFKIFKMYAPGREVLYLIISIFTFGIGLAIIVFSIRDNTPVEIEA